MADVHFKTNILLKNIIGKDLITDDNLAVLELVKNSFDAGSPEVSIIYKNIINNDDNAQLKLPTNQTSLLIIKDNGGREILHCVQDDNGGYLASRVMLSKATARRRGSPLPGSRASGKKKRRVRTPVSA